LRPDGFLEVRTDSERYYRYTLDLVNQQDRVRFDVTKNHEAAVQSKYEARWRRMEKNIYTLRLYSATESAPIPRLGALEFSHPPRALASIVSVPSQSIVRADHFVHFGSRFQLIGAEGVLVECSFGSFERPEHKVISVRNGRISYYPQPPVPTRTNAQAHHTIGEYLYA
jgi:tRNA (guanine-N7-)-methyltransferase